MAQAVPFVKGFSEKECERRWQIARELMQKNGLDAMLVIGQRGAGSPDSYLTNWLPGSTVIFPLKGEPVLLASFNPALLYIKPETPKELRPWIRDVRAGARGAIIAQTLKEKGLEKSHVGVIGLDMAGSTGGEGSITAGTWRRISGRLTECQFEDITEAWSEAIIVHSPEELAHVRRAAKILELASAEQLKVMRPGVSELEVWAAVQKVQLENGSPGNVVGFSSGQDSPYWWPPLWANGVGQPRVYKAGDILCTELGANSNGMGAQTQMATVIPPVSKEDAECARLARQSYEAGLRVLKPGKTFEEVVAAMEAPLDRPGVWHITPLIHSMNPNICTGPTQVRMLENLPEFKAFPLIGPSRLRGGEVVLKTGMVFELEPNACLGRHRVNIGGTVLVTENEPEELNEIPCQMRVVGGG